MLKFYYAPLSVNSRRVWIALLEKQIPFEPIRLDLDGDQFSPEFTTINPLQRVPVVIDDGLRLVESLAILNYLEMFGISMESFPKLTAWLDRLSSRSSFQQTAPSPEQIQAALPNIKKILEMR